MKSWRFSRCVVRRWTPDYMDTQFWDGKVCPALFIEDDELRQRARDHGYGDDVRAMHLDHDVAHTFLAEARNQPYSPTLYHVAGGTFWPPEARESEETLVMMFQRAARGGPVAPELEREFEGRLWPLARRFRAIVRLLEM